MLTFTSMANVKSPVTLTNMCLDCGRMLGNLERTRAGTGRHAESTQKGSAWLADSGLWVGSANHFTTGPPVMVKCSVKNTETHTDTHTQQGFIRVRKHYPAVYVLLFLCVQEGNLHTSVYECVLTFNVSQDHFFLSLFQTVTHALNLWHTCRVCVCVYACVFVFVSVGMTVW